MKKKILLFSFLFLLSSCANEQEFPVMDEFENLHYPEESFSEQLIKIEDKDQKISFVQTRLGNFDWTLDGEFLVGAVPGGVDAAELFLWDFNENSYRQLTNGGFCGNIETINRSPTENIFLYFHEGVCNQEGKVVDDLWTYDLDNNELINVSSDRRGDWLPDGETIITNSILESQGHQVTSLSVSPDGSYFAVVSPDGTMQPKVFLVSLETGEVIQVSETSWIAMVEWSPDGDWIVIGVLSMDLERSYETSFIAFNIENECFSNFLVLPEIMSGYRVRTGLPYVKWSSDGSMIALQGILEDLGYGVFFIENSSPIIQDWLSVETCLANLDD